MLLPRRVGATSLYKTTQNDCCGMFFRKFIQSLVRNNMPFLFCFYKYFTPTALGVGRDDVGLVPELIYFEGPIILKD